MLLTSIPNGWPQKQLSVRINFPHEKIPCNVASSQNSFTTFLLLLPLWKILYILLEQHVASCILVLN